MNQKKAKKLRQLVRHLTEKSGMSKETSYVEDRINTIEHAVGKDGSLQPYTAVHVTRRLNPDCARAAYQQMKAHAK